MSCKSGAGSRQVSIVLRKSVRFFMNTEYTFFMKKKSTFEVKIWQISCLNFSETQET